MKTPIRDLWERLQFLLALMLALTPYILGLYILWRVLARL